LAASADRRLCFLSGEPEAATRSAPQADLTAPGAGIAGGSLASHGASLGSGALASSYGQLPLAFEANQGQAPAPVNYLAHGNGYTLSLTPQQAVLDSNSGAADTTLALQLVGANPLAPALGQNELITRTNYLTGNDPSGWYTNIPNYGQVAYQGVYPGVNLVYHGNQGRLEYDFVVQPGANPGAIQMRMHGVQGLSLDAQSDLVLHTAAGDVLEQAPIIYQQVNDVRQTVSGAFVLEGNNQVGFRVGAYDPSRPLVIDPTLSYSSYLTSSGWGIAVDGSGDAYLTGSSWGSTGLFVAKLNAKGTALDWFTTLASNGIGTGIAVDASGDVYVRGYPGRCLLTEAQPVRSL
jgi:hypothetical protein